ncbi:tyrosine-type recombinase/integrase [Paenisporosarcina sp. NPDC076898]|uniref:tyrosine-type recombinase/integrase n=1 Tax=unclassified Paenisporosarcina TaxID=2642018 RepID=UPI003D060A9C
MSRRKIYPSLLKEIMSLTGRNVVEKISFDQAVENFLDYCVIKGLSEWTIKSYAKELKQIRLSLVDSDADLTDIKKLTTEYFEKFIVNQVNIGRNRNTINARIRAAKTFFNFCVKKKYIRKNPVDPIERLKVRHVVGDTFTKQQVAKLLKAPDITRFTGLRDYTILLTFLHTGIRLSELAAIQIQDVILTDKSLNIQRAKNGFGRRIPLTKQLCDVLNAYMKVRGHVAKTNALFITENETPISIRQIQYHLREYGIKTGISDQVQVSPHTFRRTFAKNKIQAGVDVFTVQALMGHSDLSILKKYVSIYSKDLDGAIERGID